nr:aldo/keto reductase [Candidatus Halobonum tyrrellensis]
MPRLGLGTYSADDRDQWTENVRTALDVGYRHVDTAQVYENEEYVGEGIRSSEVDREDVFLATKTMHVDVPDDPADVPEAIDGCLDRLGVDAVDLLYVHWPSGAYEHEPVLSAFDDAYDEGKARNVGVANFTPELLDEAREHLDAPLFANQVEMHPLLPQEELVEYAQTHDHWLVAYSPLGKGEALDVPEIQEVAERHDASPAQVCLAWLLDHDNVAAIPKASSREHMEDNLAARELELDDDDRELIDSIDREYREIDPDHGPWNW